MGGIAARAKRLVTRGWLAGGQADARRWRLGAGRWPNRLRLVESLAPGSSFLDLGGMYSMHGDLAFAAERAGASRVVLFDGMDPTEQFDTKHRERGSEVAYVQGDLHDPDDVRHLGTFDVVWCAGVIYHTPNPYLQLTHLRALTERWLLLGTEVIPEVPGIENACVFHPGRSDDSERAFASTYRDRDGFPGMTRPFDESPLQGYANMWWGMSPSAVRSMLRLAGFDLREEFPYTWNFRDFLAEAAPAPNFIPPLGFSRRRGEHRLEGLSEDELPPWAQGDGANA